VRRPRPRASGRDTFVIRLEARAGGPLIFSAGQYAAVRFGDLPPRDFSMANRPDDPILEFHIQHFAGGRASDYVASRLQVGDLVSLRGPTARPICAKSISDRFSWRPAAPGWRRLLSILETALAWPDATLHLLFGRATPPISITRPAYRARARHRNMRFMAAASQPGNDTRLRRGNLSDIIAADFSGLSGLSCLYRGSAAHCEATKKILRARGLTGSACFVDPFVTATDR